jgi:prepilin-type N-terminal cleavage/methylation domain-containing protein
LRRKLSPADKIASRAITNWAFSGHKRQEIMQMKMIRNQQGFTLIEIIAVLVILGVIMALSLPRYSDMIAQSKNSAATGAVAAAKSALSMRYAQVLLSTSAAPDASGVTTGMEGNCGVDTGDFTVTCTPGSGVVTIAVTGASAAVSGATAAGTFTLP